MRTVKVTRYLSPIFLSAVVSCTQPPPTNTVAELCQSFKLVPNTAEFNACLVKEGREVADIQNSIDEGRDARPKIDRALQSDIKNRRVLDNLPNNIGDRKATVSITIRVDPDGTISDARIFQTSGSRRIDQTGMQLMALVSPMPPTGAKGPIYIIVPIEFLPREPAGDRQRRWTVFTKPVRSQLFI